MIQKAVAVAVLSLSAAAIPCGAQANQDPSRTAVQQVILQMASHIQDGKLTAIDSLFAPRGHILTDTTTLHSWAEYRDGLLKAELGRLTALRWEHTAVEAVVRGDVSWVAFRQQISGNASTGPVRIPGRATAVLERRDGRWLIVHMHVSR